MNAQRLNLNKYIEVSAGGSSSKYWKLDLEPGLKAVAAVASLALDPIGLPAAIGHFSGALKKIVRNVEKPMKPSAEGFDCTC